MPCVIETSAAAVAELGDIVEALESSPFDARDEDAFAAFAPRLKELANNRHFLTHAISSQIETYCLGNQIPNRYGSQVIMLYSGKYFAIRANIWPDIDHPLIRSNGMASFFYGVPHDHNMSFLTVGYAGSGYWSDYYEYDYGSVSGLPGERVALKSVERSRLDAGKVQLYRAHRDVHCQLPPDDLSISLNIMESSPAAMFLDQYIFDTTDNCVSSYANPLPHDPLFAVAAAMHDPEAVAMLRHVAAAHPSTRVRFSALRALSASAPTSEERIAVLETAAADSDSVIKNMAAAKIAEINRAKPWIDKLRKQNAYKTCH